MLDPGQNRIFQADGTSVQVWAYDANHCPGAVMLLFETERARMLYTGDFRLNDEIADRTAAWKGVDALYADSTYDSPQYRFPPQEESIRQVVELVGRRLADDVFIAVYRIGKNKVIRAVSEAHRRPVYMPPDRYKLYEAMGHHDVVTTDREATNIAAYSRGYFGRYFRWHGRHNPLVIIPTGWAVDQAPRSSAGRMVYVPYSEHCDYAELHEFIDRVQPDKVIPI